MEPVVKPMLYIVPTPIGNLGDMTLRGLEVLRAADIIACEDTRHSQKLLNYFDIRAKLVSYHDHNEQLRSRELLDAVAAGKVVCVISDAGMPGISDPGGVVIAGAIEASLPYTVLPGASAQATALVASGFDTERFAFYGFLPTKDKELEKVLDELEKESKTFILYEAPHRLTKTLKRMATRFPHRRIAVMRELTKLHEEYFRTTVSLASAREDWRGEIVLVVEGCVEEQAEDGVDWRRELVKLRDAGFSNKDAIKALSALYDVNRNDLYKMSLADKSGESER